MVSDPYIFSETGVSKESAIQQTEVWIQPFLAILCLFLARASSRFSYQMSMSLALSFLVHLFPPFLVSFICPLHTTTLTSRLSIPSLTSPSPLLLLLSQACGWSYGVWYHRLPLSLVNWFHPHSLRRSLLLTSRFLLSPLMYIQSSLTLSPRRILFSN